MNKRIIYIIGFIVSLSSISGVVFAQIPDDSMFRIYRSEFIFGAITQIGFDSDNSYEISVTMRGLKDLSTQWKMDSKE